MDISSFNDLLQAARAQTEPPLRRMVEAIRRGTHCAFIPFDRQGQPVLFE